ncbi:MAG: TPM domain-containing protein [Ignavibacteriaceae bacterium]|nr:TPM domain-containing protein [Ignavibacterium sp.]MCC6256090.1 TPM domain-containing protein [Ignavibacteriaceae bacterium]HRP92779.1 TPM domain-containing protein [Ignavibacteriaceae bacterium]
MKIYFAVFLIFAATVFGQPEIPKLTMWATDFTNTLSQSELSDLNIRLKTYADTSSNQVIVLMIPSLEGYPIEMLAEETATKNKIGTKKNDNGILLLIAKDDKELRIEVGYGLEGAVPDAIASSIIRNVIRPQFRNYDYYAGISDGVNAIIKAIGGEYVADESGEDSGFPFIIFVIIIIVIFLFIKNGGPFVPGGVYRTGTHSGGGWSSGNSSWGGSSGWSGGGGGFSGGGGSFGGGGASGSW